MTKLNNKKGISLIVLVITIIVMIILAAAIILSLQSSDIIGKANEAKLKSDEANAKQVVAMAKAEWELMSSKEKSENGETFSLFAQEKLQNAGFSTEKNEGSYEVAEDGNIYVYPVIPDGFVASKAAGENTVQGGLVIYKTNVDVTDSNVLTAQKEYDQFVWVPVPNINDFTRVDGYMNGKLQSLVAENTATEPSSFSGSTANQYATEVAEYNAMKASVEKYGGFYIARYEAGDGETAAARTTYGTSEIIVSRKDAFVYNYVCWGASMTDIESDIEDEKTGDSVGKGAVYLSQNMYEENKNYTTHLIYGVQWDATLRWIEDKEHSLSDSRNWGNYTDSIGPANTINGTLNMNYKTGRDESWKAKNIYDLAGNVEEWTMEASSSRERVRRGGKCSDKGTTYTVSSRSGTFPNNSPFWGTGFRPALYLK